MAVPHQIQQLLRSSPSWNPDGHLLLSPKWAPLTTARKEAPLEPGLYALGLPKGIRYDSGTASRIIYLGSATKLKQRLQTHDSKPHNDVIALAQRLAPEGLLVSWWAFPGLPRKWLRGLEGESMWAFEAEFGIVPIANLDIPESSVSWSSEGLVRVPPCKDLPDPLTLDQFAQRAGLVAERGERSPIGNPNEVSLEIRADVTDEGMQLQFGRTYKAVRFVDPVALAHQQERERRRRIEDLSMIWQAEVAAWTVRKVRGFLKVCKRLRPASEAKRGIRCFEAPAAKVPKPHTWGEVALLKGRLELGTWFPNQSSHIEVLHAGKLLGFAFLEHDHLMGKDESDLPQIENDRPSYYERFSEMALDEERAYLFKGKQPNSDQMQSRVIVREVNRKVDKITVVEVKQEVIEQLHKERMLELMEGTLAKALAPLIGTPNGGRKG